MALQRHRLRAKAQKEHGLNVSQVCSEAIIEACEAWDSRNAPRGVKLAEAKTGLAAHWARIGQPTTDDLPRV